MIGDVWIDHVCGEKISPGGMCLECGGSTLEKPEDIPEPLAVQDPPADDPPAPTDPAVTDPPEADPPAEDPPADDPPVE